MTGDSTRSPAPGGFPSPRPGTARAFRRGLARGAGEIAAVAIMWGAWFLPAAAQAAPPVPPTAFATPAVAPTVAPLPTGAGAPAVTPTPEPPPAATPVDGPGTATVGAPVVSPALTGAAPPPGTPAATASPTATATAPVSPTATASSMASSSATATASATATSSSTATATATSSSTATATATTSRTASPTATGTATRVATAIPPWRARGLIVAREFEVAPAVDLEVVPVTSTVLGPDQVAAFDVLARAGTADVVVIDAHLDFPSTLQVTSVDRPDGAANPLPVTLSERWDNEAGTVDLAYGTIVGEAGAGASGYFRVARLGIRPAPGALAGATGPITATVAFAAAPEANRATAVYGRTTSLLRHARPLSITLDPAAGAIPAFAAPDATTLFQGIAGEVAFTVLDAANARLASATFIATLDPPSAGTVVVATGTTGADGTATVRVRPATSAGTAVVDLVATGPGLPGGTARRSRLVAFATPLPVSVMMAAPAQGALVTGRRSPARVTTAAGPGAFPGTTVEVDWSWSRDGVAYVPFAGAPTVAPTGELMTGLATATWDTTVLGLAPPGSMATGVVVKAVARATFEGVTVGQGEATATRITIDNFAPPVDFPTLNGAALDDDLGAKRWFRTRSLAFAGEAEVGVTLRAWRLGVATGLREDAPVATCVVPCAAVQGQSTWRSVPGIVEPREFRAFTLPIALGAADEVASGFILEFDAVDLVGNVGPAVIEVVNGFATAARNPIDAWIAIDTGAPRVARMEVPVAVAAAADPPSTVTVGFTEPVLLPSAATAAEWVAVSAVTLETRISNKWVPVDAALSLACAAPAAVPAPPAVTTTAAAVEGAAVSGTGAGKDARGPVTAAGTGAGKDARGPATGAGAVAAREACADGVASATFTLAGRPYPGGSYVVAAPGPFVDLAGNASVAPNPHAWTGPGTPPLPEVKIAGLADGVVLHGTAANPVPLAATTANVDTEVTWRLCADANCGAAGDPIATLGQVAASDTFGWDTTATGAGGARLFPDRRDAFLVAEAGNTRLVGAQGQARAVRRVTLRSVPPALDGAAILAGTCPATGPDAATAVASSTFNLARGDCDAGANGLQVRLVATVADSVGGTIDVSAQVAGGAPVTLATNVPFGVDGAWSVPVTLPQGAVTLVARARDVAWPVANVAPDAVATFTVDTVAPVTTLSYPPDGARLAAPGGTASVPVIGATESGSAVTISLTRDGGPVAGFPAQVVAAVGTGQAPFRYPATGGSPLVPGLYALEVAATDPNGNPGVVATRTFRVTPPPVAASLDPLGEVGATHDADADLAGIQVVVTGRLAAGTTADKVPDGMVARLRRDGADATGAGNRPVVAPVVRAGDAWTFAFPALTFTTDATASFTVVTADEAGNRSIESSPVTLSVDTTAPQLRIAAPVDGGAVGTTTPELAVVVAPRADGTWDVATTSFKVRPRPSPDTSAWDTVATVSSEPGAMAGASGVVRVDPGAWTVPLPDPVAPEASRAFDLLVTARDRLGNARTVTGWFVLQPGAPSVQVTASGAPVIGNLDLAGEGVPVIGATVAATGSGVTITGVSATIRMRGAAAAQAVAVGGTESQRTLSLDGVTFANGTVHDLAVTAIDSQGRSATTAIAIRVVRPRDLAVTVARGGIPIVGASVRLRRDAADLPAVALEATTGSDGAAPTFAGVKGGPVLVAIGGVPGYPVTTVAAQVTEPHALAGVTWAVAIDLDALNPNVAAVAVRGLPSTVTGLAAADLAAALRVDVTAVAGTRLADAAIGGTSSGLSHAFGDEVAKVERPVVSPTLAVNGSVVNATVRVPAGAASWRVAPVLSATLAAQVQAKGAADATAVFTANASPVPLPVTFRFVANDLRVKSLSGTVTRPDGRPVAGATVVASRAGGLSVSATTTADGEYGPVALEAGTYVVTAIAAPGADWIPGRVARVSFAGDDQAGDPESAIVAMSVDPAGGTVQGRLARAVAGAGPELTTGTIVLQGDGRATTAVASAAVLQGQDAVSGANFAVHAPAGTYVMSVIPDDPARTPPPPLTVRLADGRVTVVPAADLPPLERTLARIDGLVRLATGDALPGVVVQARLDGTGSIVAATTDATGRYLLAVEPGTWTIGAAVSPGSSLMPGNRVVTTVGALAVVTVADIVLAVPTATIERTLAKAGPGGTAVALIGDEAADLAGTAFLKDEATGSGTSLAFQGARLRLAVPEGRYRLGIAINAGGFLAPEAETGVVTTAGTPNVATRLVGAMATRVTGRFVTGPAGTPVALRAVIRATGLAGATAGTVIVTESAADGSFAATLAPGTWRFAAAPDAASGYVANVDRPWVDVTVGSDGAASPAAFDLDLAVATRTIAGTVVAAVDGADAPLAGVRLVADLVGSTGAATAIAAETGSDGTFTLRVPAGAATLSLMGANARHATAGAAYAAGDPAWVVDPVPTGLADGPLVIRLAVARAILSGTVTGNGRSVGGATVVATLAGTGQARTATTLGGSRAGEWSMRLPPGAWSVAATADVPLPDGNRVPAASVARVVEVTSSDLSGIDLALVASTVILPPPVSAPADPATGGVVRAGRGSAELRIAPGAVSEPVTVNVEPLGAVPTLPGFVPFGDAFRITATTATGVPVVTLAIDSSLLVTYSSADLASRRAPSTAAHGLAAAQAADLRPARFDPVTSSYTALLGAVATAVDGATGLFTVPTTTLGTFVLTAREALVALPPPPPSGAGGGTVTAEPASKPVVAAVPVPAPPASAPVGVTTLAPRPLPAPAVLAPPRFPARFAAPGRAGFEPAVAMPAPFGVLPDGRIDARAPAPADGAPIIVPVDATQVVAVEVPSVGAVVAFVGPRFAGVDGGPVIARVPATVMAGIQAIAPGATTRLQFDPYPVLTHDAQYGFLGGGNVIPIGSPVDLRLDVRDVAGRAVDLGLMRTSFPDGGSSAPGIDVAIPVPARFIGSDATYSALVGLYAPGIGGTFLGYARPPAEFDADSVTHVLTIDVDDLDGTLLLPVELRVAYVANFVADAHLYSNPGAMAVDLGPVGGPFTPMRVVGPQVGGRIFVVNPRTGGVGWVDAAAVGPEDPAKSDLPLRPAVDPSADVPREVRTRTDAAHVHGHEGPTAIDFGPVGPAGTILTVIGPALDGRVFVFNPSVANYGWVDLADLARADGTPLVPDPAPVAILSDGLPETGDAVTVRDGARLWSNPTRTAVDFGPVGPAGTRLFLAGPREGARRYVLVPATNDYAWIDADALSPASR